MRSRALLAFLWAWALWSVGAALEFLLEVPTGILGLLLGVFAAAAILARAPRPAMKRVPSSPHPSKGTPATRT